MGAGGNKSCSGVVDVEGSSNADGGLFKFVATMDKDEETFIWIAGRLGANPKTAEELKARMVAVYTRILNIFLFCLPSDRTIQNYDHLYFDDACVEDSGEDYSSLKLMSHDFFVALVLPAHPPDWLVGLKRQTSVWWCAWQIAIYFDRRFASSRVD